jgi:hypothetical protein
MPWRGATATVTSRPGVSKGACVDEICSIAATAEIDFLLEGITMKVLLSMTLMATVGVASAADVSEIEKRRLFQPTQAELQEEAAGRIYIYDGLTHADIERAMDEEFHRVESMMFIRVKKTDERGKVVKNPETGDALVEDDGC